MNRHRRASIQLPESQQSCNLSFKGLLSSFVPKKLLQSVNESSKARNSERKQRDSWNAHEAPRNDPDGQRNRGRVCKEEYLDFGGMGLKSTKGLSLFRNVKKPETVERVSLDHNRFESLPEDVSRCLQLRVLSATDNELNTVPHWIASLIALSELDLRKNNIQCLPESFKCLKRLSVLNLSFNPLTCVDHSLVHCSNLAVLNMNDCCLQYLPATIGRLQHLRVLEMRNNSLQSLPAGIGRLGRLEFLDIGGNRLMQLPDTFGNLMNLKVLLADENRLHNLPEKLDGLTCLEFFDVSSNELRELTPSVGQLSALETFLLGDNRLVALPETFGNLGNLKLLRSDKNSLRQLPSSFGKLHLKEFSAVGNEIPELPANFCFLHHLEALFLDQNRLQSLPAQLGDLRNLSVLSLRGNSIESLPSSVGNLSRLVTLDMRENRLRWLPTGIRDLKSLRALWLGHNQASPKLTLNCEIDATTRQKVLTCYLLPQETHASRHVQSCHSPKKAVGAGQMGRSKRITFQQPHIPTKGVSKEDQVVPAHTQSTGSLLPQECPPAAARALEMLSAQHEVAVRIETSFGSLVRQAKVIKTGKISPRLLYQLDKIKNEQRRSAMFQSSALTIVRNRLDFSCTTAADNNKRNICRPPSLIRPYAMIDLKTLQAQVDAEHRRSSVSSLRNGPNSRAISNHEYEAIFDFKKKSNSTSSMDGFQQIVRESASRYNSCMSTLVEETQKKCDDLNKSL